jgi:hypothetical protein
MAVITRGKRCGRSLATVCLVILSLSNPIYPQPVQKKWSRYLRPAERGHIYKNVLVLDDLGNQGFSVSLFWISDAAARAVVSSWVDHEKLPPEEAEKRYLSLRQPDRFLVAVSVDNPPELSARIRPEVFLLCGKKHDAIAGTFVSAPFRFPYLHRNGVYSSCYLVSFARERADGGSVIEDLSGDIRVRIEYPSGAKTVFVGLKGMVDKLDDL